MRITTVQTSLSWENSQENRQQLEVKLAQAEASDLVVLPEMFTTGFSMRAEDLFEEEQGETLAWMKAQAKGLDAVLIGSFIVREDGKYFNRLYWVEPNGQFDFYDKRHLFRMAEEDKTYSAGANRLIKEWKGWKICPVVCYDLRFPVWLRNTAKQEGLAYDLLICVANWPAARRDAWNALLKARAIENLSYVVGVNRIGEDGKGIAYAGDSQVIGPKGELIYEGKSREEVITTEINMEPLTEFRAKFPAYLDADQFRLE